jgi:long-chain acyl-CoA synthetase
VLLDEMANLCKDHKCSGLERPRDCFVTDEAFSVENNLLTPTFKLKRNVVQQYFDVQIKQMYSKLD